MVDYSLPIAKRTRLRRALICEDHVEHRKKRKKRNRADSASANVRGQVSSDRLGKSGKRVNSSENCSIGRRMEAETTVLSDDSDDASLEEIDASTFGKEGGGSVTFVTSESSGLKDVRKFKSGLEGIEKGKLDVIDFEDEVILIDEEEGFDSVNSNCSISKTVDVAKDGDFVCVDVDNDDSTSGLISVGNEKSGFVISPNSTGRSNCLNVNGCESGGRSFRDDSKVGEQEKSDECDCNAVGDEFTELEALSTDEDNDDSGDENYELEKSDESQSSECSSSKNGEDTESYCAGSRRGRRRGRRKGDKWIEAGLKRRKAFGLDILVDLDKDGHDNNDENENAEVGDVDQRVNCVARRTRSRFSSRVKKMNTELGTVSQPLCVDEEESDSPCDEKELDSPSKHDNSDSCDNIDSEVDETYKRRQKTWSSKKKTELNNQSDNGLYEVEKFHGGRKIWHDERAPGTNKGNQNECLRKIFPKNCQEFDNVAHIRGRNARKTVDVFNILIDSIIADKELPLEELVSSTNQVFEGENNSHVVETSLPLKFNFGLEESRLPEKSEHEKELDKLWAELDFALRSSEMGLVDSNTAENEGALPSKVERVNLCLHGDHQLVLDEQVGLRCTFCSYVKLEIKYIVPSFDTNPYGKSQKRESGLCERINFDDLQQDFDCDPHNESDSHASFGRTVWDIIPGIRNSMYPHQREGFEFIWKNIAGGIDLDELKERNGCESGSGCIVSHAPGTGKTRLTIVFLQTYMELYPTCRPVIIAPSSMLLTWEEEFLKWKVDIPFHNLNKRDFSYKENIAAINLLMQAGPSGQSVDTVRLVKLFSWKKEKSILGISYRLFEILAGVRKNSESDKVRKILLELPDLVVFDEGHIPRNDDSLIWMTLSKIKTERRIILSGTPFQNNFTEFFNTLQLVRPKFADSNNSEDNESFDKKRGRPRNISRGKWDLLTSSIGRASDDLLECAELKEIRALINPFVHVYRGNILQEKLPGLRKCIVILQPAELQKSLFQSIQVRKNSFEVEYAESLISVHPSLMLKCDKEDFVVDRDMLERLRLNPELGVKIKLLLEIIHLSEALNEKVLIFSQYIEPLSFIGEHLKSRFNWTEGIELFHMNGRGDLKKRQSLINIFNDPTSEVRVLLASTRACSEGINLVGASRVVLLDVVWNPSVERQAICRAYRLGQKKVVYIYHLITSGTREEEKYSRQVEKDRLSELVFSPDHSSNQENLSSAVLDDKILEAILQHEKLKNMFQKIAYQSKESSMNDTFDLAENQ